MIDERATEGTGSLLSFERRPDAPGVDIVDHVERRQLRLETDAPVDPAVAPTDEFHFPVDRGIAFRAGRIALPHTMPAYVRNREGWMVAEFANDGSRSLPPDRYSVELCGPIKLYAVVEGALSVSATADRVTLEFDDRTEVALGARSHHKRPAATITTTEAPEDMMEAVSYLGSSLKTTTCERSYPTLRGHPPLIEVGPECAIPSTIERPETGITIELPPEHRPVFVAAPLAYYLGAAVVPGPEPRLVTDAGFEHSLDDPARGFQGEVERVLKQAFFFDCVTRTEGYYQVDLHERQQIEGSVDWDFAALYDRPAAEQLARYLEVPYSVVEPHLPRWKLTAHVAVEPARLEAIPYLANDLAVVRTHEEPPTGGDGPTASAIGSLATDGGSPGGVLGGASARGNAQARGSPKLVRLEESDSLEQAWIGEGVPIEGSKAMIEAYRNRIDRDPTEGSIEITVVCNDTSMGEERDVVDEVYGSRETLPFDVSVRRGLTTGELEGVLRSNVDFLHYIGHIDPDGFECVDGSLDAAELSGTGVDAFFLNACSSYRQGLHLIESGSIAGVVTLQDVINSGAQQVGETFARLLNQGFPIRAALNIAKGQSIMGGHYLVLGDGNLDVTQSESGTPVLIQAENKNQNISVDIHTYPTKDRGMGSYFIPYLPEIGKYFISSGSLGPFRITKEKLINFLKKGTAPVMIEENFYWTKSVNIEDRF